MALMLFIKVKGDHGVNINRNDNTNGKKGGRIDRVEVNQEQPHTHHNRILER